MFCKQCGAKMKPEQAYCLQCGVAVGTGTAHCSHCGESVAQGAALCVKCGTATGGAVPVSAFANPNLDVQKNRMFAWIMATIPITGMILGSFLGFGYMCLVLNILFAYLDSASLKKQGVDTDGFGSLACLVPFYLYKRAKALGDNLAYVIVWIVLFALIWVF